MTPRLHTPANFLHLPEDVPEIFDIFFDAVVGLGVLVGEYLGQTVLALRACMRARLNNW